MSTIDKICANLDRIDPIASQYVRDRFEEGTLSINTELVPESSHIIGKLFMWVGTPQGSVYWLNIHTRYQTLPKITKKGNSL